MITIPYIQGQHYTNKLKHTYIFFHILLEVWHSRNDGSEPRKFWEMGLEMSGLPHFQLRNHREQADLTTPSRAPPKSHGDGISFDGSLPTTTDNPIIAYRIITFMVIVFICLKFSYLPDLRLLQTCQWKVVETCHSKDGSHSNGF